MKVSLNHYPQIQTEACQESGSEFLTFNQLLKTVVLQGHLEAKYSSSVVSTYLTFIHQHLKDHRVSKFVIRLDEMNIPTTKLLFDVFKAAGNQIYGGIRVCWFCNPKDQQMRETGLNLGELYGVKVTVLPV